MLWWEFVDVAYFTVNARTEDEVEELWQETKGNLTAWNDGNMMLYNNFKKTLFKKCGISFRKDEIRFRNIPRSNWSIEGILFEWWQTHTRWKNKDIAYEAKRMPSSEDNYLCKSLTWKPLEHLEDLRKKWNECTESDWESIRNLGCISYFLPIGLLVLSVVRV